MNSPFVKTYSTHIGDSQLHMIRTKQKNDAPHRHVFFEFVYVMKGSATHLLQNVSITLKEGDYFIIDPGSIHCYQNTNDFEISICLFLPEYIDRALKDCPSLSSLLSNRILHFGVPIDLHASDRVLHDNDGSVGRTVLQMEREYKEKKTGYRELIRCDLTRLLVCAVRYVELQETRSHFHDATLTVMKTVSQNLSAPLSLENLSRMTGYTPQYLSSLFKADTGICIREFLIRLRVEEACRLLAQKDYRIHDLATAVGYGDAKHFAQVFRKRKGCSPKEFRKNTSSN